MKRLSLRFLTSRKFWQRSAFALACLATLVVAAYAVENYRGEKAWAHYRAEAEARGVKLDFKDFIPAPIPDEENFAAIPIYRELLSADPAVRARVKEASALPRECLSQYMDSLLGGTPPDFAAVRDSLIENNLLSVASDDAVADVLRALERYEPALDQLRAAAARPRSRLDSEWEKGFDAAFWRLGDALSLSKLISLRVSALLAKGRAHEAWTDWHAGYRHAGVFQGEPTLLACMLRVAVTSISTHSILQGLPAHAWSEDELKSISDYLASIDLMADFTFGMSSERAFRNVTLDRMKDTPGVFTALQIGNPAEPPKWSWDWLIPRGWFAQNQRRLNEWYDWQIAEIEPTQKPAAMEVHLPNFDLRRDWIRFPYWFVVCSSAYPMGGTRSICRETQVNVDLCLVACALERFRLRHGDYPKELRELVPDTLPKLPRDRFDGQPLRYRRTDEGGVTLYSAGKDCRDDGGDHAKDSVWHSTPIGKALRNP